MMKQYSQKEFLWIFNYDGTLCNPVPDRREARLEPSCEAMLLALARIPLFKVAVLSSRPLDDLASRIEVPELYLGGANGTEWLIPGQGRRQVDIFEDDLNARRKKLLSEIGVLKRYPGVEIEDRRWSICVRMRNASELMKKEVELILYDMKFRNYRKFRGPDEIELPVSPDIDKAFGMRSLCEFLDFGPQPGKLFYAGDHENDIPAMNWVRSLRGVVFTVGGKPLVLGSKLAASPAVLAERIASHVNSCLRGSGYQFGSERNPVRLGGLRGERANPV